MTNLAESVSSHEQLILEGLNSDFGEKIYPRPNLELLARCSTVILEKCEISEKDFEARNENASLIGVVKVAMYNRLISVEQPTEILVEDVYTEVCTRLAEKNEVLRG